MEETIIIISDPGDEQGGYSLTMVLKWKTVYLFNAL